ncbi:MAG: SDR family oxidoreductase [Mesorhizobium sp.]
MMNQRHPFSLANKRILVVGGSSGIGLAVAKLATELGGDVFIASRSPDKLEAARQLVARIGVEPLDATDPQAVANLFSRHDPFDHVVVSAAEMAAAPLRGSTLESQRAAMDSKFWSAVHIAREARLNEGGSLTFVSGALSRRPAAGATLLGAINVALEGLAQGLALELAPIRVNCVSPGRIDTAWWDGLPSPQRKAMMERTAQALPVRRVGEADDVAVQIIACLTNTYMTGSVVFVDGGYSISS